MQQQMGAATAYASYERNPTVLLQFWLVNVSGNLLCPRATLIVQICISRTGVAVPLIKCINKMLADRYMGCIGSAFGFVLNVGVN